MNIYHEIINNEVYPALGCTEPTSCAYAAAVAAEYLNEPVESIELKVDRGTFKNGAAVTVPYTGGETGNLIACALGAIIANSKGKLEVLKEVTPSTLIRAKEICRNKALHQYSLLEDRANFCVQVIIKSKSESAECILSGGHINVELIKHNDEIVYQAKQKSDGTILSSYRDRLRKSKLADLFPLVDQLSKDDLAQIKLAIDMNLKMSTRGREVQRTAYQLYHMQEKGYICDDLFYRSKLNVAAAVDARMSGIAQAVMTSGGSGNQGILTVLVPYYAGQEMCLDDVTIYKSIALAHIVNAYTKCFIGELSVICGCAMSAGIAVACAIVYQKVGIDMDKMLLAVNNVIGDLGGLICDGAKPGCALKSMTSADAALRAGFMAAEGHGVGIEGGIAGSTIERSIQNLGRITLEGMLQVDPTVLKIMQEK